MPMLLCVSLLKISISYLEKCCHSWCIVIIEHVQLFSGRKIPVIHREMGGGGGGLSEVFPHY